MENLDPNYISGPKAVILEILFTFILYMLLKQKYRLAMFCLAVFAISSSAFVHPLTRGLGILTNTALSVDIRAINSKNPGKWISEGIQYENFPLMNGAPSLSGVYYYPQKALWDMLPPKKPQIYNRYAHVVFDINHGTRTEYRTELKHLQQDVFVVRTEPCSSFLKNHDVKFILAQSPISNECLSLVQQVNYPNQAFFIYQIL